MLPVLPYSDSLGRLAEPRNIADIVLVFLLVYGVLKLLEVPAPPDGWRYRSYRDPLLALA